MMSKGIIILLLMGVVSVLASPSRILRGLGGQGEFVGPHVGHSHCGFDGEQVESHGKLSEHGYDHGHDHNHGEQHGGSQGGSEGQGGSHDGFREHNHGHGGHDNHY